MYKWLEQNCAITYRHLHFELQVNFPLLKPDSSLLISFSQTSFQQFLYQTVYVAVAHSRRKPAGERLFTYLHMYSGHVTLNRGTGFAIMLAFGLLNMHESIA